MRGMSFAHPPSFGHRNNVKEEREIMKEDSELDVSEHIMNVTL
jgi:hypothetical protein